MTIQEKINKRGFNLVACYNNGFISGYFATHRIYAKKTLIYKTQTEVFNAIKNY